MGEEGGKAIIALCRWHLPQQQAPVHLQDALSSGAHNTRTSLMYACKGCSFDIHHPCGRSTNIRREGARANSAENGLEAIFRTPGRRGWPKREAVWCFARSEVSSVGNTPSGLQQDSLALHSVPPPLVVLNPHHRQCAAQEAAFPHRISALRPLESPTVDHPWPAPRLVED